MNPSMLPVAVTHSAPPADRGDAHKSARVDAESLVTASASPRADLSAAEQRELFDLLSRHFDGVTETQFAHDLHEKDWVLRIRRGTRLVGFTTLQVYTATFDGHRINVVYSGDTITDPDVWGSPVLARGWIAMVREIQGDRRHEPWYWLLLSSGYRTYRFLPVFWREFWPRCDADTPSEMSRLLTQLATQRFGAAVLDGAGFCAATGVVRFSHPQRLRGELAQIPEGKHHDPHVAFFLARNVRHAHGDELVCLTNLGDHNLTAAGARMLRGSSR